MSTLFNIVATDLVRNPAKKQASCKSSDYKNFNSILTFPPKFFSQKSPNPPPISGSTRESNQGSGSPSINSSNSETEKPCVMPNKKVVQVVGVVLKTATHRMA